MKRSTRRIRDSKNDMIIYLQSGVAPHGHVFYRCLFYRTFDLAEFTLIIPQAVPQGVMEVLGVPGADAHDRLGSGLVGTGNFVQKDERHFIFLECDLDTVAIDGVKSGRKVDRDFVSSHAYLWVIGR
jgi:hypothetical protein